MNDLKKTVQDAAYVVVGLGVIGFQRAQVRRQELRKQLESQRQTLEVQMDEARRQFTKLVKDFDDRIQPVRAEMEERMDTFEARLPIQARDLVHQFRTLAKETETQARKALDLDRNAA